MMRAQGQGPRRADTGVRPARHFWEGLVTGLQDRQMQARMPKHFPARRLGGRRVSDHLLEGTGRTFIFYKLPLGHLQESWVTKGPGLGRAINGDRVQGATRLEARGEGRKARESMAPVTRDRMARVASEQVPEQKQHKQMWTNAYYLPTSLKKKGTFKRHVSLRLVGAQAISGVTTTSQSFPFWNSLSLSSCLLLSSSPPPL